ncbi:uncharacterized protein LOC142985307 isoform X1 [Anticarsia gemmatalis]|uniref:uncharacterized protein LOC142985307 isoform X1 n=1 Tax=Anticarsia gemmatalis TaxID=129554 RepID=UPI003F773E58
MSNINPNNEKKKALLAFKEKILEEIQYYEKSIDDFRANHKNNSYYDDGDSSESEDDFPNTINIGPDVSQLKLQQSMLQTCLQATQELTSLTVLQSEINVLVEDPKLEKEQPVTETGTWKEVTAECRVDLVPFTITFYMHTPDRKFGPISYRGLQVSLIKSSHEIELNKSVLHTLKKPSDAVEVVRSYATAYRSRRTTLARLANKYGTTLFMEPHPEGGFILKCANLLEISWRLENKWSPVAPFHHKMKFDLEYMDESYIKIITGAHKQLLDPSIQTDERTLLLSKIITTCLQARGPVDSESDLESRQTEIQAETQAEIAKDSEVMAPPKSLPKKTKKLAQKRSVDVENSVKAKKSKIDSSEKENNELNNDFEAESNKKIKNVSEKKNSDPKMNEEGKVNKKTKITEKTDLKSKNNDLINNVDKNINSNIPKKRKIDDHLQNEQQNIINAKLSKKSKSNEEIKRNVETVTKKAKSSDNIKLKNKENNTNLIKNTEIIHKKVKNIENGVLNQNKDIVSEKNAKTDKVTKKTITNNIESINNDNITNIKEPLIKKSKKNNENIPESTTNRHTSNNNTNINTLTKQSIKNTEKDPKNVTNNKKVKKTTEKVPEISNNVDKEIKNTDLNEPVAKKSKKIVENNKITNKEINNTEIAKNTENVISKNNFIEKQNLVSKSQNNKNTENSTEKLKNGSKKSKLSTKVTEPENLLKDNNETVKKPEIIKKVDRKIKMSIANDKKFDLMTKKVASLENAGNTKAKTVEKNVATSKNSIENRQSNNDEINTNTKTKNTEKAITNTKNKEMKQKSTEISQKPPETAKSKTTGNTETMKKVTEKNAIIKSKDRITNINKVSEKIVKDKPTVNKVASNEILKKDNIKKITKLTTQSVRNMNHRSPKNLLKAQNPHKIGNTKSNTKMFAGNTEKENGGKISKIPQKKMSPGSDHLKMNILRISPRSLPSNFVRTSQGSSTKNMAKNTNIPRLLKKPVPKS